MTRNGKIARLPRALREQINQRLQNGEPGEPLLAWLNPLPEVQTLLQKDFAGIPISKQNLSEWRNGGFVEWELKQDLGYDAQEAIADSGELDPSPAGCLADHLSTILAARYASLLRHWDGEPTDEIRAKVKVLGAMIQNVSLLRRWDHSTAKLQLAQEQQEDQREKAEQEELAKHVQRHEGTLLMRQMVQNLAQATAPKPPVPSTTSISLVQPPTPLAEVVAPSPLEPKAQSPEPDSPSNPVKVSQGTGSTTISAPPATVPDPKPQPPDPGSSSNPVKVSQASVPDPALPASPRRRTSYDLWPEFVACEMDSATLNSLPTVARPAPEVRPNLMYDPQKGNYAILTDPDQPPYPGSLRWGKGLKPEQRPYRPTMCQGKCNLHGGKCTGCQRSEDEITLWPLLSRPERVARIHAILERRLAQGEIK